MKVIPTLLTLTKAEFIHQMDLFQKHFPRIQLDIADSTLVPNRTVQIPEMIECVENGDVTINPDGIFDFHLMVEDYMSHCESIRTLSQKGMKIGVVLVNAKLHPDLTSLKNRYGFDFGLDIFPEIQIADVATEHDLTSVPVIQVMTVHPGFQGSPFLPEMLMKIEQLRNGNYKDTVMIDGGVNDNTLLIITQTPYKPDYLCIGSFLTKAEDKFDTRLESLQKLQG
jgi:ribulose-phosphate 3-epimerase